MQEHVLSTTRTHLTSDNHSLGIKLLNELNLEQYAGRSSSSCSK
jgi:hypothetical protein